MAATPLRVGPERRLSACEICKRDAEGEGGKRTTIYTAKVSGIRRYKTRHYNRITTRTTTTFSDIQRHLYNVCAGCLRRDETERKLRKRLLKMGKIFLGVSALLFALGWALYGGWTGDLGAYLLKLYEGGIFEDLSGQLMFVCFLTALALLGIAIRVESRSAERKLKGIAVSNRSGGAPHGTIIKEILFGKRHSVVGEFKAFNEGEYSYLRSQVAQTK